MPAVESRAVVPIEPALAFAVSQTTGAARLRWDPFVAEQRFLDGATRPAKGVRTFTRQRFGLTMVSEYASWRPPTSVGMRMRTGPWFLDHLGGGWRFEPADERGSTLAIWRYSFGCRPSWARWGMEPVVRRVLQREIDVRIRGFVRGCSDAAVLAAARRALAEGAEG